MTNRDTRETRDVLKAMERKANSPKKAEIQKKRFEEASTAMQRLTLTADENTEYRGWNRGHNSNHRNNHHQSTRHPVYSTISLINGKINRMDLNQLKTMCRQNNLSTFGKREAVIRRLKEYIKTEKLIEAGLLDRKATLVLNTDYFVVIDFEATCEEKNPSDYPHEIIEFPAVLVSTESQQIVDHFHSFVRPVINPKLSDFCKNLTGVEQKVVDGADPFPLVHARFLEWMDRHGLGKTHSFTIVTDGPFDMGRFLFLQVKQVGMSYPLSYASYWANLRKCFANFYKRGGEVYTPIYGSTAIKLPGLQQMLDMLGLTFEGSPHSGFDDAKNIARILIKLLEDRAFVRVNERIVNAEGPHTDDRGGGRLSNVAPVTRKEAEKWLQGLQKKFNKPPHPESTDDLDTSKTPQRSPPHSTSNEGTKEQNLSVESVSVSR